MTSLAFDTHDYVKKLKAAGFTEQQAEVQAETLVSLVEDRLATKQDIKDLEVKVKELEIGLEAKIKEVETRLEARLAEIKAELIKWMVGLLFVQAGFIVAMLKL